MANTSERERVGTAAALGGVALLGAYPTSPTFQVAYTESLALLLLGVPGTAKSWLSEHLAAAISGDSTLMVQGTAGTAEEAIRYGWNYDRLLAVKHRYDPENLPAAIDRLDGRNATVGILRLKRDVGKENHLGLLATSYNFADRSNYVGGFDGRFRFDKMTTAEFQVLGTNSRRCDFAADPADDTCRTLNGFAYAYNVGKPTL